MNRIISHRIIVSRVKKGLSGSICINKVGTVFFSLLFLFFIGTARAQGTSSNQRIHNKPLSLKKAALYLKRSQSFLERSRYDSSLVNLEKALKIYKKFHVTSDIALCYANLTYLNSLEGNLRGVNHYLKVTKSLLKKSSHINPSTQISIYDCFGDSYRYESKYDTAQQYLKKACKIYKSDNLSPDSEIVRVYNDLGSTCLSLDQSKVALKYFNQALSLGLPVLGKSNLLIGNIYNNIGLSEYNLGNMSHALKYYTKDLSISKKILGKNNPDIGKTYNNIGGVYFNISDYGNAAQYYKEALRIFILNYGKNRKQVARVYNNIGAVYYYENNYREAIHYFKKSLDIKKRIFGNESNDVAIAYLNIGDTFFKIKKHNEALYYFKKSLAINLKLFSPDNPNIAPVYESISECYSDQKKYSSSIAYLYKELDIYLHTFGFNHPLTAHSFISIGKVYLKEKQYHKALDYYQKALKSLCPNFHNNSYLANPDLSKVRSEKYLLKTLKYKASTLYEAPGSNTKKREIHLVEALKTYSLAARLINKIREGYKAEESKLTLGEQTHKIYEGGIKTSLKLYKITHQSFYKNEAFEFLEKSKSNVLLEAILDSRAKEYAGIPDSLIKYERTLRKNLTFYTTQLHNELSKGEKADSLKVIYWQDKIFTGNRLYHAFMTHLEQKYPKYYQLKYETPKVSIQEIRNEILNNHSALLSYFKGTKTLYIFTITKNDYQITTEKIDSNFVKEVREFRKGIIDNNFSEYTSKGYELYRLLLAPVPSVISHKNLIVIPDGILGYIPFGALITRPVVTHSSITYKSYENLPYLILHHNITYSYSTSLLLELSLRPKNNDSKEFLGIAPVFDSAHIKNRKDFNYRSGDYLSPLPASEQEVKGIYNLFEKKLGFWSWVPYDQSEILLRNQANESFVKSNAISQFRYIHFATHAFINEQNPNLSGVVLAHKPGSGQDGILYAGEIYNLKLHADLVVLSACETAMGKLVKGEGIMSLTRPFLYAGASNVIVSLWNVADRSTSKFMITFYKNLLNGQNIPVSLANAKRELIRKTQYSSPLFWSPFILIGSK